MMEEQGAEQSEEVKEIAEPTESVTESQEIKDAPVKKAPDTEKKIMRIYIVILTLIVIAGGAYILYQHFHNQKPETENTPGSSNVMITKDNRDASRARKKVAEGMITVKMTTIWTFADGNSAGDGYVANSTSNSKPLKVRVTLEDTGDVVLNTEAIPVGSSIEKFKLDKVLEKGEYSAIVEHMTVDEDGNVDNVVRTSVTIVVSN